MILTHQAINSPVDMYGSRVFGNNPMPTVQELVYISPSAYSSNEVTTAIKAAVVAANGGDDSDENLAIAIEAAVYDSVIRAERGMASSIAASVGINSVKLETVRLLCTSSIATLVKGMISELVSKLVDEALNALGAIPIVGWIVLIVKKLAKDILRIRDAIHNKKNLEAVAAIADMLSVGQDELDATFAHANEVDADQAVLALDVIASLELDRSNLLRPHFRGDGNSKKMDGESADHWMKRGGRYRWLERGVHKSDESHFPIGRVLQGAGINGGAFGYIPGTTAITEKMVVGTGRAKGSGCRVYFGGPYATPLVDQGSYKTLTAATVGGWWSKVNEPSPTMFSVNTGGVKDEWEDYAESMFILARDITVKRWAGIPGGIPFTDRFICHSDGEKTGDDGPGGYGVNCADGTGSDEDRKRSGSGGCKPSRDGDKRTISKSDGEGWNKSGAEIYIHACKLFFGITGNLGDSFINSYYSPGGPPRRAGSYAEGKGFHEEWFSWPASFAQLPLMGGPENLTDSLGRGDSKNVVKAAIAEIKRYCYEDPLGDNSTSQKNGDRFVKGWFIKHEYIDFSKSIPSLALDTLRRNRHEALLNSMQGAYIDADDEDRFQAFRSGNNNNIESSNLRESWERGISKIIQTGSWKNIRFHDMPDGVVKNAIYEIAKKNGYKNPEEDLNPRCPTYPRDDEGNPVEGEEYEQYKACRRKAMRDKAKRLGFTAGGIDMSEEPSLPESDIPEMVFVRMSSLSDLPGGGKSSGSGGRKSSSAPLLLGAGAAAALMMMRNRR
jgi:hypothetical protein